MNFKTTKTCSASLLILLAASCATGIDDDERFSGGVTNVQLESPELTADCFSTIINPDGSGSVKVTWPVVFGAGGYLCNVAIVDDPAHPVPVVTDSVIDGCTMLFSSLEDTNYEISVLSLGNDKLNNKPALQASVCEFSTMVPAISIPTGVELSSYIGDLLASSQETEVGFELAAGATYELAGELDFGLHKVTLRGNKANHPTIVMGEGAALVTQAGLQVKFLNFDCTNMKNGESSSLLKLSSEPDPSLLNSTLGYPGSNEAYIVLDPIVFSECMVKNIPSSFVYTNKQPWALYDFRIMDCLIQLNNAGGSNDTFINLYGGNGLIKNMTLKNSTFYNTNNDADNSNSSYFIRYNNASNAQPTKVFGSGDNSSTHLISNCTFSRTFVKKDFANNMLNNNVFTQTVENCMFFDVFRIYQYLNTNNKRYCSNNFMAYDVTSPQSNDTGGRKDTNGQPYTTQVEGFSFAGNPLQELDFSSANGGVNLKPSIANVGDPRWYE
ncbi:MAG: DUF4992 family lipoprotein [Staphylococcus sp.]|nr:DUF4992 family lipoprotein [Staphylococcus sp.]